MVEPLSATYYNNQVARASAALAGAGAWDATPLELVAAGFDFVTLFFDYTRGAAGGGFEFYMDFSPLGNAYYQMSLFAAGVLVPASDIQSEIQRQYINYLSTGAGAESFIYGPVDLRKTIENLRVLARESGVVGTPGTLAVRAIFS